MKLRKGIRYFLSLLVVFYIAHSGENTMLARSHIKVQIPEIDRHIPGNLETATFAMG